MFERFTPEARHVVKGAQQESRQLNHGHIGTEHLLLGLLDQQATTAFQVLSHLDLTHEQAVDTLTEHVGTDELDVEGLETLGIDISAVREKVGDHPWRRGPRSATTVKAGPQTLAARSHPVHAPSEEGAGTLAT